MGFLPDWTASARAPLVEAIRERNRFKAEVRIFSTADTALATCNMAWDAYHAGGVAALFDLVEFVRVNELPVPNELLSEMAELSQAALTNTAIRAGGAHKNPVGAHRAALIKRLRFEHVRIVLAEAWRHDFEDRVVVCPRVLAQMRADRLPASTKFLVAAEIAITRMPDVARVTSVTPEAVYRSFDEVGKVQAGPGWPGLYYLPSSETCHDLEWDDLVEAFLDAEVSADAPRTTIT